jgi:hypothetical protein
MSNVLKSTDFSYENKLNNFELSYSHFLLHVARLWGPYYQKPYMTASGPCRIASSYIASSTHQAPFPPARCGFPTQNSTLVPALLSIRQSFT